MILQESSERLLDVADALHELLGFLALFLAAGAIGFRYTALRDRLALAGGTGDFFRDAARRAAGLGLTGVVIRAFLFWNGLPNSAARAHTTVSQLVSGDLGTQLSILFLVLAVIGLVLALAGQGAGWPIAAVGVVLGALPGLLLGRWSRLVNPAHALSAGLWIGTLFVLVVAGIAFAMRDERVRAERGVVVADMVHAFSPLALVMGGLVVLLGVITAWRHLNPFSSLWSTPYGYALMLKLIAVAIVFSLGAFNWKRQRPTLGGEESAQSIMRSSRSELAVAGIVLILTAVLVSLPSPRPPGPPPGARPAGAAAGPG